MKRSARLERDRRILPSHLEELHELSSKELREHWRALFGAEPPPKLRASLLVQAIAYRLQEKALGGLKPATVRLLERIADDAAARRRVSTTPEKVHLREGTVWSGSGTAQSTR